MHLQAGPLAHDQPQPVPGHDEGGGVVDAAAARAYVTAAGADDAAGRAQAALDLALTDQGFTPADATATTACELPGCLVPEGAVSVTVRVAVPLPFVPPLLRAAVPASVPVQATGTAVVDRFSALRTAG